MENHPPPTRITNNRRIIIINCPDDLYPRLIFRDRARKSKDIRDQGRFSPVDSIAGGSIFSTSSSCRTVSGGDGGGTAGAGFGMAATIRSMRWLRALPAPVVRRKLRSA